MSEAVVEGLDDSLLEVDTRICGEYDVAVGAQAPINDELSARVAVQERSSDGYGFDVGTDTRADSYKDWAGRILLRDKRDDFDATLDYAAAPFEVTYFVASWRRRAPAATGTLGP